jgi:GTP-binding protein
MMKKARIIPPIIFSLEEVLRIHSKDEYVEVTPKFYSFKKMIY